MTDKTESNKKVENIKKNEGDDAMRQREEQGRKSSQGGKGEPDNREEQSSNLGSVDQNRGYGKNRDTQGSTGKKWDDFGGSSM